MILMRLVLFLPSQVEIEALVLLPCNQGSLDWFWDMLPELNNEAGIDYLDGVVSILKYTEH